jgi:hypothetical protein
VAWVCVIENRSASVRPQQNKQLIYCWPGLKVIVIWVWTDTGRPFMM